MLSTGTESGGELSADLSHPQILAGVIDGRYYLRDVRADIAYFGRSFHRAHLMVDINGLDVEASARKIEDMLRKRQAESGR